MNVTTILEVIQIEQKNKKVVILVEIFLNIGFYSIASYRC